MPAWAEVPRQGKAEAATVAQSRPSPGVGNPSHSQFFIPFVQQTFLLCLPSLPS